MLINGQAIAMELDFSKGFFKVPWGASPKKATEILGLKQDQIADADSRLTDKYISFTEKGIKSNLFFFKDKLWSFNRSIELRAMPDPKSKSFINIFTKKLNKILKDQDHIQCTVSSSKATHVFNGPPEEEIPLTVTITVTNLKLKKQVLKLYQQEMIKENEAVIDNSLKKLLNQ